MSTFVHPDPGFELDWLAVDQRGRVGLFSTGGQGAVPVAVANNLAMVEAAILRLASLPILGDCAESPGAGGDFSFWIEPARRGIFGFDWGPVSIGPYARVTVPSRPVLISDLDDVAVREAATLVQLPLDFEMSPHIEAVDLGVDLYRGQRWR